MSQCNPRRGLAAKKQLEHEFIARRIVLEGQGEPLAKADAPGFGQRIRLPPLFAGSSRAGSLDQAFGDQPLQGGVDLSVALAPEAAEVLFNGLVKLIAGEIRLDGEPAEQDVGCATVFHIAVRYI